MKGKLLPERKAPPKLASFHLTKHRHLLYRGEGRSDLWSALAALASTKPRKQREPALKMTTGNGETGEGESSFVELMDLVSRQQREEVLEQILQLLLQCSRDGAFVCFLINSLQTSRSSRDGSAEKVVTALRRLLRLVGSKPVLSVTATEILINFTADEQLGGRRSLCSLCVTSNWLMKVGGRCRCFEGPVWSCAANLMLGEFKDMATLLLENLKRQQQQQQRGGLGEGDDGVPMHLSVSLMLLSNVTRHRQAIQILFNPELPLPGSLPTRYAKNL